MLPVLELGRLGIADPHINSDVVEWQAHQRDIWLTDHECHLQITVNISHKHSQAFYNIHTIATARWYPPRVMYTSWWAWKIGGIPRYKTNPMKIRKLGLSSTTNKNNISAATHTYTPTIFWIPSAVGILFNTVKKYLCATCLRNLPYIKYFRKY